MNGDSPRVALCWGSPSALSPRRLELASFDNAYRVALRARHQSGLCQFVIRTGNPLQPVRTACLPPAWPEILLATIA